MKSLNPRFDGAFLNSRTLGLKAEVMRLNPRFDGAFLNLLLFLSFLVPMLGLNPRFDGAFLNFLKLLSRK